MNYKLKSGRKERGSGLLTACKKLTLPLFTFTLHLTASAVSLSLSSTNDYQFVEMPTNWTPQIVGLGCGPDDTSAAIRAEDVFFLNEAMREREFVADALCHEAKTNSTPYKQTVYALATPIPNSSHMLELGNGSTNLFSGTFTSSATGFIAAPKEILGDFVTSSGLGFSQFMTNFYTSGIPPSSHRYWDFHVDERWKRYESIGYPYPMIVRGVCTNLYHDLSSNTFVAFIQPQRTGPNGINDEYNLTAVCDNFATGIDKDGEFVYQNDYDISRQSHVDANFSLYYKTLLEMDVSGSKNAYVSIKNGSVVKSGTGTQKRVFRTPRYSGTFAFTYPDPILSSRIINVVKVFVTVVMDVEERSKKNGTVRKVSRRGVYPIAFSNGPTDPRSGCPSCTFTLDGMTVMQNALSLFGERVKSPDELLARCDPPENPVPGSSTGFLSNENYEIYAISISVPYVIAIAEVDFHAKTLERNNQ